MATLPPEDVSVEELQRAAVTRDDLEGIERFRQVLRDLDLLTGWVPLRHFAA